MPTLLNPDIGSDMLPSKQPKASTPAVSPILILSPSSLSHRPQILESLLSSLPSSQPHDLHMLDRIAMNFAVLPSNYYNEAILALPPNEETANEIESDYIELKTVFTNVLQTMRP
jgi:Fe-S cluster assembly protein DRE2 N-terminus